MRFLLQIAFFALLISCNDTETVTDETTGTVMEIEPTSDELNQIALAEQPQVIQDFFKIDEQLLGSDFCYDNHSLSQLIIYGNDSSETWTKFEVSENYLTAYHSECEVLLEFMTFEMGTGKKAFLSQMNRSAQKFNCLNWSETGDKWLDWNSYPQPGLDTYFGNLNDEEVKLVKEYGSDFIYINPKEENATFIFSEWLMQMNMGEKEMLEFNKEVAYDYELIHDDHGFSLNPVLIARPETNNRAFLVGYSQSSTPTPTFQKKYDALITALPQNEVSAQIIHYGSNDFNVYFPNDTFNFAHMEQFELRDGFWFYEYEKEPLDLGAEEGEAVLIRKALEYFNENINP